MSAINLQSIGLSCQTRHQVESAVREQTNPQIDLATGLFDWLICPPEAFADLLAQDFPPFSRPEIEERSGRAFWSPFSLYFWHGFQLARDGERFLAIDETFAAMQSKYAAQTAKFRATDPRRTMFIWSNTQNNLATDVFAGENAVPRLGCGTIERIQEALDGYFGERTRVIFMTSKTRSSREARKDRRVFALDKDDSEWKGHETAWRSALTVALRGQLDYSVDATGASPKAR